MGDSLSALYNSHSVKDFEQSRVQKLPIGQPVTGFVALKLIYFAAIVNLFLPKV